MHEPLWDLLHSYFSFWAYCTKNFKPYPLSVIQLSWPSICTPYEWVTGMDENFHIYQRYFANILCIGAYRHKTSQRNFLKYRHLSPIYWYFTYFSPIFPDIFSGQHRSKRASARVKAIKPGGQSGAWRSKLKNATIFFSTTRGLKPQSKFPSYPGQKAQPPP